MSRRTSPRTLKSNALSLSVWQQMELLEEEEKDVTVQMHTLEDFEQKMQKKELVLFAAKLGAPENMEQFDDS